VGARETAIDALAGNEEPQLVRRGRYLYPPGLRMNLVFYRFHGFFEPGNPILLFEHLTRYGRAAHYRILWNDVVLLHDPTDIREVLVDKAGSFGKDRTQRRMKILLGDGMITADGATHKRGRRAAAPAFHRRRIEDHAGQIFALAGELCDDWVEGQPFDVAAAMMDLALRITARTLFDTPVTPEIQVINEQVNIVMDLYNYLITMPRAELLLNAPLPGMRRFRKAKTRLDQVVDAMIRSRRAEALASPEGLEARGDLLSMLLAAGDDEAGEADHALSSDELRDQVLTLFLAGYETVANLLAWTWLLLGQNPEAETELHAEIDAVLGGRPAALDDVPKLEYTAMVLAEAMRLYPPAWAMGREALEDVSIGPYRLRKGTSVFFSQYIVQRNPRWFPEPDRFLPQRFSPEVKTERPRFAYFPFGGGGRQCIGESFAMLEATLALATIAQRWQLKIDASHPIALQPKITLRPRYGVRATPVARRTMH
jgi:cytochrome P450